MAKKDKIAAVFTGIVLFLMAAVTSLGLIQSVLDFGSTSDANIIYKMGKMLGSSFGISSICIPLYLYFAGALCFASRWTFERAVALMISVIPFYTLSLSEKLARSIYYSDTSAVAGVKIGLLILIALLVVAAEYLVAFLIAGKIRRNIKAKKEEIVQPEKVYVASDDTVVMDENDFANMKANDVLNRETVAENEIRVAPEKDIWSIDDEGNLKGTETVYSSTDETLTAEPEVKSVAESNKIDFTDEPYEPFTRKEIEPAEESESEKLFGMPFDESEDEGQEGYEDIDVDFFATLNPSGTAQKNSTSATRTRDDYNVDVTNSETLVPPVVDDTNVNMYGDANAFSESEVEPESEASADDMLDDLIREFEEANREEYESVRDDFEIDEDVEVENPAVTDFTKEAERLSANAVAAEQNKTIVLEDEAKTSHALLPGLDSVFARMDFDAKKDAANGDIEIPVFDDEVEAVSNTPDHSPIVESANGEENVFNPVAPARVDANGNVKKEPAVEEKNEAPLAPVSKKTAVVTDAKGNTKPIQVTPKKKNRGVYKIPTELLTPYEENPYWIIDDETKQAAEYLKQTLQEFKIEAEVTGIQKGPVVTMFEILPAPGVKLNRIVALQDNIALRLAASSVRIVAPIPGKRAVGIEVPNRERAIVSFRECVERNLPEWKKMAVPVVLGKDIEGQIKIMDLVKTPHLLIAGATGAGKSVCVNSMILSILYKRNPNDVKMILIDPKIVELKLYNDIPHLLTPVITEPKRAMQALQYCLCEMERRYALLDGMGCRDISSYNHKIVEKKIATEHLPYIIVVIDEFADLMATTGKQLESVLARLAAMSRAVGIHLVLATQRPSIDVITGLIKANIPSRIAFMVTSKMDSRIIIDQVGADKLLGRGDMLYASATDPFPVRIQGTLVSDQEVENVVNKVKEWGEPEYIDDEIFVEDDDEESDQMSLFNDGADDPLYEKALDVVIQSGKASASYIQRRLKIGYNRAARLVELMEERGIVGPPNGSKPREIIHMP